MKEYLIIGGEVFEYLKSKEGKRPDFGGEYEDIFDCYNRPSYRKIQIWEFWKRWINKFSNHDIGISSHNSHFFTITGWIISDGWLYGIKITVNHNYIWKIEELCRHDI